MFPKIKTTEARSCVASKARAHTDKIKKNRFVFVREVCGLIHLRSCRGFYPFAIRYAAKTS
jgi:hypothetical protein